MSILSVTAKNLAQAAFTLPQTSRVHFVGEFRTFSTSAITRSNAKIPFPEKQTSSPRKDIFLGITVLSIQAMALIAGLGIHKVDKVKETQLSASFDDNLSWLY